MDAPPVWKPSKLRHAWIHDGLEKTLWLRIVYAETGEPVGDVIAVDCDGGWAVVLIKRSALVRERALIEGKFAIEEFNG